MPDTTTAVADSQTAVEGTPTEVGTPNEVSEQTEAPSTTTDQPTTDDDSEVAKTPDKETESDDSTTEESKEETSDKDEDDSEDDDKTPFHKHPAWQRMRRTIEREKAEKEQFKEVLSTLVEAINRQAPAKDDGTKEEVKVNLTTEPDFKAMFDGEMEALTSQLAESNQHLTAQQEQQVTEIAYKYGTRDQKDPEKVLPLAASQAYQIYTELVASKQAQETNTPEAQQPQGTQKKGVPSTKPSSGQASEDVGKIQLPTIPKGASMSEIAAIVRNYTNNN